MAENKGPPSEERANPNALRGEVESTLLSLSRSPFMKRCDSLLASIQDSTKTENQSTDGEEISPERDVESNFDPMAIRMISGDHSRMKRNIHRLSIMPSLLKFLSMRWKPLLRTTITSW